MIAMTNQDVFVSFDLVAHFLGIATHDNINAAPALTVAHPHQAGAAQVVMKCDPCA